MTDMILLAERLSKRIEWQSVPDNIYIQDLTLFIADAIRDLYVMTGRALAFSEEMFTVDDDDVYVSFADDLPLDEVEYVLVTAEMEFYKKAQSEVDTLTSYTTDAMAVTHGDKPFANLQQKIDGAKERQLQIWYKMYRYHLL